MPKTYSVTVVNPVKTRSPRRRNGSESVADVVEEWAAQELKHDPRKFYEAFVGLDRASTRMTHENEQIFRPVFKALQKIARKQKWPTDTLDSFSSEMNPQTSESRKRRLMR